MDDKLRQSNPGLQNLVALIAIALELKYGKTDQMLTASEEAQDKELIEDQIKDINQQIQLIKNLMKKIEEMIRAMEDILPKLTAALQSDMDNPVCSDSDPRKWELLRLCHDPVIVAEDWQRLSKSYSPNEKEAFVEWMRPLIDQLGLADTYPRPTLSGST